MIVTITYITPTLLFISIILKLYSLNSKLLTAFSFVHWESHKWVIFFWDVYFILTESMWMMMWGEYIVDNTITENTWLLFIEKRNKYKLNIFHVIKESSGEIQTCIFMTVEILVSVSPDDALLC